MDLTVRFRALMDSVGTELDSEIVLFDVSNLEKFKVTELSSLFVKGSWQAKTNRRTMLNRIALYIVLFKFGYNISIEYNAFYNKYSVFRDNFYLKDFEFYNVFEY